jgi:hypothetical protein
VIATPDEVQDGKPVPRIDVVLEVGRLKERGRKVIVLKESSTALPVTLNVVYFPFEAGNPSDCLTELDGELTSIFGNDISTRTAFRAQLAPHRVKPSYVLEGKGLIPERPDLIQKEVLRIFLTEPKKDQARITADVVELLDNESEDTRWVAGLILEEILEYDASLVPREAILKMSEDHVFSLRSCAAVCLFALANMAPSLVPLDVAIRLASTHEDWYVSTPALATLKTLAHKMPRAFDAILRMACSQDEYEAEQGADALLEVVRNDPDVIGDEDLKLLERSPSKYAQEAAREAEAVLKTAKRKASFIRYSPF